MEDPQGLRCPFGAHIRRANPRESADPGSQEQLTITNRHRILRVGRRYQEAAGAEPGLFFMCLNADLERQFEFVQQTWLQSPSFHSLVEERDPLLGMRDATSRPSSDDGFTIPTRESPVRLRAMPEFVRTLGGGYFFVPGRSCAVVVVVVGESGYHPIYDDLIAPRLDVNIRRPVDRRPYGLAPCLPPALEVEGHHRHHAAHAGPLHRRDDGDFLHRLFADVEAAAVSGAGADRRALHVRREGRPHHMPANVPFYLDYSKNATSYESIALWTFFHGLVGEEDSVVRLPGVRATAEIFYILRMQPVLGTFFTKEQNKPGADKVIVLTQSFWQTQFQEDPRSSARTSGSTRKRTR